MCLANGGKREPPLRQRQRRQKPALAKTPLDRAALDMLSKTVTATADEDGRANLARVGAHPAKQSPDFDPRNYGFPRLSNLVEASGIAQAERIGENPKIIMVRLKSEAPARPAK
jgi:OST-HTH/LOTUS domain